MPKDNLSDEERLINNAIGKQFADKLEAEKKKRAELLAPQIAKEMAVLVTDDEKAALKALGYNVKESAHGWSPRLTTDPTFAIRGWMATENGAWQVCQENAYYRHRDKLMRDKWNEDAAADDATKGGAT